MVKAFAKLTFGIGVLAAAAWFGTSSSQAYGNTPWCAVTSIRGDVYWDCNLNPWPGLPQVALYKYPNRHADWY